MGLLELIRCSILTPLINQVQDNATPNEEQLNFIRTLVAACTMHLLRTLVNTANESIGTRQKNHQHKTGREKWDKNPSTYNLRSQR